MGSVRKTERHWKAIFCSWTTVWKAKRKGFLYRIVTGDEKWIIYNNVNQKRSFCQFGGITKVLCILICFQTIEQSTQMFTDNNLWNWRKQSKRKGQNWQIAKKLYSTMRGETSHIFNNTYETIGAWFGSDVASSIQSRLWISKFTKLLKWKKISVITMTSNRTWLSFLLLRTRNSIIRESWSYQKGDKRLSTRMEDIWLIKVHFLCRKNWVLFHIKKPKLLSCQPNAMNTDKCSMYTYKTDEFSWLFAVIFTLSILIMPILSKITNLIN